MSLNEAVTNFKQLS